MAKTVADNFEVPVWNDLGKAFYLKLNRLSRKYSMMRADLLTDALQVYDKARKSEDVKKTLKAAGVSTTNPTAEDLSKVFATHARNWWATLTPEQYEEEKLKRRLGAKKRWAKRKSKAS